MKRIATRNHFGRIAVVLCLTLITPLSGQEPDANSTSSPEEHGKYLVHHVAMCIYCHTPKDGEGNLFERQLLGGAPFPLNSPYSSQTWGFQAPNLRSLPARWGEKEFIRFLQTGKNLNGYSPRPPMPPFRFTQEDAQAIAAYLNTLPNLE